MNDLEIRCDNGANELACAIFLQAVEDWRKICKLTRRGEHYPPTLLLNLRKFFKSEWCQLLVSEHIIEATVKQLESELLEAQENQPKKEFTDFAPVTTPDKRAPVRRQ